MNIYIEKISTLSINQNLLLEYIKICEKYQIYSSKKEAENDLKTKIEIHHILPKSFNLGGEKDKLNLTYLPLIEHREVHKLLKDMFNGEFKKKMCFAYSRLIHRHGSKDELTDIEYVKLKTDVSKLISEMNSNRIITDEYRNNMSLVKKNTIWINNGINEFMIHKNDFLPDNFKYGRISNFNKNKIWINNGLENKMVPNNFIIPEGWTTGIFKNKKEER